MSGPDPVKLYKIQSFLHLSGVNPNGIDGGLGGGLRSAISTYLEQRPELTDLKAKLDKLNAEPGSENLRAELTNDLFAHVEAEMAKPDVRAAMIDKAQAARSAPGASMDDSKAAAIIAEMTDPQGFKALVSTGGDKPRIEYNGKDVTDALARAKAAIAPEKPELEENTQEKGEDPEHKTLADKGKDKLEKGKEVVQDLQQNDGAGPYLEGSEVGVRIPVGPKPENEGDKRNYLETGFDFGLRSPVVNLNLAQSELSNLKVGMFTNTPDANSGLGNGILGNQTNLGGTHSSQYNALGAQYTTILNPSTESNGLTENVSVKGNAGFSLGGLESPAPVSIRKDPVTNKLNIEVATPTLVAGGSLATTFNVNSHPVNLSTDLTTAYALGGDNPGLTWQSNTSASYRIPLNDKLNLTTSAHATIVDTPGQNNMERYFSAAANLDYSLTEKFGLYGGGNLTFGSSNTYGINAGADMEIAENVNVQAGVNINPQSQTPIAPQLGFTKKF